MVLRVNATSATKRTFLKSTPEFQITDIHAGKDYDDSRVDGLSDVHAFVLTWFGKGQGKCSGPWDRLVQDTTRSCLLRHAPEQETSDRPAVLLLLLLCFVLVMASLSLKATSSYIVIVTLTFVPDHNQLCQQHSYHGLWLQSPTASAERVIFFPLSSLLTVSDFDCDVGVSEN